MIVRRSFFDTIINLYKPYIMDNCIKFVSKLQFLTFCDKVKIKKELNLSDLALSLCCLGRIHIYERLRMEVNQIYGVYQRIRTILNVNKFIGIYLNALLVVQKRYTCTTVF